MTSWDDLTDDDESVVDALARPGRADGEADDLTVSAADLHGVPAPVSVDDDRDEDGGVADPSGSVRVWVDESFAVVRVLVSTRWRHASAQPLGQRLLFAAQSATMGRLYVQAEAGTNGWDVVAEPPRFGGVPLLEQPFDERLMADLRERSLQISERLDALCNRVDVRPTVVRHEQACGRSQNHMVSVILDHKRRPSAVTCDERWVAGARTEKIIDAVQQAFADAYAQWREPVIEPGEHDELAQEFADLRRLTMLPLLIAGGWIDPRKVQA